MIWFILGALFGVLLMAVFNMCRGPSVHITCKDCVHRDKELCPLSHFAFDEFNRPARRTDTSEDFYCREAKKG